MQRLLLPLLVLALADPAPVPLSIDGPTKSEPYKMVDLVAKGVPDGAAVIWDVTPEDTADVRELPGGRLVLTGPPGVYRVKVRSIRVADGKTTIDSARTTVTIGTPPPDKPKPSEMIDPAKATGKLRHGNSSCTATVIAPRRTDGKWDVLTAAHCSAGVGSACTLTTKDGAVFALKVAVRDTTADITWLTTEDASTDRLWCAQLAEVDPLVGAEIWHNGFGIDKPGNREDGVVTSQKNGEGQLRMTLSVSPGDSGGGIFRTDDGKLVAVVSATTAFAQKVTMYGGSASAARALRPKSASHSP